MNIFVRRADDLDWGRIEEVCRDWLGRVFDNGGEWHYRLIKRQLLVEPFLGGSDALPLDYKLWTFNGGVSSRPGGYRS